MKPSSRIMAIRVSQSTEFPKTDASVSTGYYKASELERTVNALIEYLDEQAKLLDTHTVKEEKGECTHQFITVDTGVSQKRRCAFCNKDEPQKEEPTTPELNKTGGTYHWNGQPNTPEKKCTCGSKSVHHKESCPMAWSKSPEKKCCDECICNGMAVEDNLGMYHIACNNHNGSCHNSSCPCHKPVIDEEPCMCPPCRRMRIEEGKRNKNKETKLPTSSYEVTCGRCEKLFYHRCGKV